MIEDKLTHDERLRLEAVAQTNARVMGRTVSKAEYFAWVYSIEDYVRNGRDKFDG